MSSIVAPVTALLLSVAILLTGNGLQVTLLPIRAQLEVFSTLSIGLLGSAYYLGFGAGCYLGTRLVARVGHIRTFTAMSAIATAAILAHALVVVPAVWWIVRSLTGFCFACLFIVIESWLNERSTKETRGRVLSVYLTINLTVITLGQMLLTLTDPAGFVPFAIGAMLITLAAVPVALTHATAPAPITRVPVRIGWLYRLSPVGFLGCLGVGLSNGAFWALGPVFAGRIGFELTGIALLMSATVLGGAAGQLPVGRLSDKGDRRQVLVLACVGASLCSLIMVFAPVHVGHTALFFAALWGSFAFPLYGIAVAHANDFARPDEFVRVSAGMLLVFAAGAALGPLLASATMTLAGARGLYLHTTAIHLALAAFAWRRTRSRSPIPDEERVGFVEALEAAQTVSPAFDVEIQAAHTDAPVDAAGGPTDADSRRELDC